MYEQRFVQLGTAGAKKRYLNGEVAMAIAHIVDARSFLDVGPTTQNHSEQPSESDRYGWSYYYLPFHHFCDGIRRSDE
jgi:hypothetical protein